ncbi:hypothetical protein ABK040_011816 [Willaertia magna]
MNSNASLTKHLNPFIKPPYYFIIILYIIIFCTCIYYISVDEFNVASLILSASQQGDGNVLTNSKKNFQQVFRPAFSSIVQKTKTIRKPVLFASILIGLITYIIMRVVVPYLLKYWIILDWKKHHTEKDQLQNRKRTIRWDEERKTFSSETFDSKASSNNASTIVTNNNHSPIVDNTSSTSTNNNLKRINEDSNYISTTTFDVQSYTLVALLSFVYAAFVYLGQPIQVWCLAISFIQFFVFHTGKSFYPLAIFTIFIAIVEMKAQLTKWKNDKEKNERLVKLSNGKMKKRGELVCGDEVFIDIGEEVPADLILTDVFILKEENENTNEEESIQQFNYHRKPILFMNEVTVTGENDPVKKSLLNNININTIRLDNLLNRSAVINEKYYVDESYIIFANSIIASTDQKIRLKGIVSWVGTETKSLHSSNANEPKQPTPFLEYANKGFFLSLFLMLFLALVNSIGSFVYGAESVLQNNNGGNNDNSTIQSFGKVFLTHLMFINMMVPQGLEQLRTTVCHLLSFNFRANVKCNNPLAIDVLAHVNRLILDKTGTITCNLMVPKYTMLFLSDDYNNNYNNNDYNNSDSSENLIGNNIIYEYDIEHDVNVEYCHLENCFAIFSTTGVEPEERAIRKMISKYSKLESYWPIEPQDIEPGSIQFSIKKPHNHHNIDNNNTTDNNEQEEKRYELKIHVAFGFIRELLCKASLFEVENEFYIGVQAGDELFWKGETGVKTNDSSFKKLDKWNVFHNIEGKSNDSSIGAPRTWSHGIKKITKEEANQFIKEWHNSFSILEKESRSQIQLSIIKKVLTNISLTSITHMIDAYREGVKEGIENLTKNGRQVVLCTGDSMKNAKLIATHLKLPNHFLIEGKTEEELLISLERAENCILQNLNIDNHNMNHNLNNLNMNHNYKNEVIKKKREESFTFFFDRPAMEVLRTLYTKQNNQFKNHLLFEKLFFLLNKKLDKKKKFQNFFIFCRATPGLKLFCVKLLQYYYQTKFSEHFIWKRNYVLAMGDGTNDQQMLKAADVSFGIKSGETEDVIKLTDIYSNEWYPIIDLLNKDGLEKAIMLSTMVKATFLKHWTYSMTLWSDLIYQAFPLLPNDPSEPMLMMIFNAIVFGQIASHVSNDYLEKLSNFNRRNLMSTRAFLRWVFGASATAFTTHWIIRWFFPYLISSQFAALVQISQAVSITVYLYLSTNNWYDDDHQMGSVNNNNNNNCNQQQLRRVTSGGNGGGLGGSLLGSSTSLDSLAMMNGGNNSNGRKGKLNKARFFISIFSIVITFTLSLFITKYIEDQLFRIISLCCTIAILGYPSLYLFKILAHDFTFIEKSIKYLFTELSTEEIILQGVKFSHTPHLRILLVILFSLFIKIVSGIPLLGGALVMIMSLIATIIIYVVFVSRMGFLRALLDGRSVAVGFICFLIGVWIGRSSVKINSV